MEKSNLFFGMCEIVKYIKIKINSIGTLLAHWTVGKYGYSGQSPPSPIFSEAEEETIGASLPLVFRTRNRNFSGTFLSDHHAS